MDTSSVKAQYPILGEAEIAHYIGIGPLCRKIKGRVRREKAKLRAFCPICGYKP